MGFYRWTTLGRSLAVNLDRYLPETRTADGAGTEAASQSLKVAKVMLGVGAAMSNAEVISIFLATVARILAVIAPVVSVQQWSLAQDQTALAITVLVEPDLRHVHPGGESDVEPTEVTFTYLSEGGAPATWTRTIERGDECHGDAFAMRESSLMNIHMG